MINLKVKIRLIYQTLLAKILAVCLLSYQRTQAIPQPPEQALKDPESIFILRNNDLGDLLIITPLFEALKKQFPQAKIVLGIGDWATEIVQQNPHISEIISVNAPWFNRVIPQQKITDILTYIFTSPETAQLGQQKFTIGIDIFGSYWGAFLLLRAKIPYRLGVKGYAGGHQVMQQYVQYNEHEQVGRSALRFAELLGVQDLPECRPQLFLSAEEKAKGEQTWAGVAQESQQRVIVAAGSGLEAKCWPLDYYVELVQKLAQRDNLKIVLLGGKGDTLAAQKIGSSAPNTINLVGKMTLRETFALTALSQLVLCNSSMMMHAAAAFSIPTLVLLGDSFASQAQHDGQWGYESCYHSLGKELGQRDKIYTPHEVLNYTQYNQLLF
ncbi:glycosyltransferase family 9 protein [Spirulina subsalsa FACHB-351]|uniref:Glycosyltransferase family 9 protein n=1 Tax=Spirulina subsalsa FACHB-351 TaxID=234711 RepID=A0ABT3L619_9CYAN|nr:glycosyltransferase family 9 protein [Spirulina subsalsa]MCW6036944.1 glycosyltransferase family 9 protein [Spirulina subsalsa FACHB-351]